MNSIIRNGNEIQLTDEEVRSIVENEHEKDVRYEVEQSLSTYEEDGVISFDDWQSVGFAEYSSREDARNDFIEYIVEHILEMEDNDERTPRSHRYVTNFDSEVYDTAEDLGYLKGE